MNKPPPNKQPLPMGIGASKTHNSIMLRPPPGTRFTVMGMDVHLQCQRGREREVAEYLRQWIDSYVMPEADRHDKEQARLAQAEKEKYDADGNLRIESLNDADKEG